MITRNESAKYARFIGGLLVPEESANLIDKAGFIRRVEAVNLPGMDGVWHLVFSGRFVYTLPEDLMRSKPLCRLRTPILVDLMSWCASYASRPGYLSLHGKKR